MASRSRGPLRAFRIADPRHPLFDGTGAYLKGARWNSPGNRIIYAAETYAGAMLEALVHLNFDEVPEGYGWIEIDIPEDSLIEDSLIEEIGPRKIPAWNSDDLTVTRQFGDGWYVSGRTPVLLVPSVVTSGVEKNVLINQQHADFARIRASEIHEVIWDDRLFRASK